MTSTKNLIMPANCTALTEQEMVYTDGGIELQTVARGVVAVGGALALTFVGGAALKGLGTLMGDNIIGNFIGGVGSIATGIIGGGASLIVNGIGAVLGGAANLLGSAL